MLMKMAARVRGLLSGNYPENSCKEQIAAGTGGELSIAQGLPELTEVVRLGNSYQTKSAGITALTVLPTTTSGLSLYNGEPATGMCYAIDSFGSWEGVIDATQADTTLIFAMLNKPPVTNPTFSNAVYSLSGRWAAGQTYAGRAASRGSVAVTNEGWFAHGPQAQLAPAVAGANWKINECPVRGLYLVPPGGMFNIHGVKAGAAAASQQFFFIRWHEVQVIWRP